jgi:hypothetical protein
MDKDEKKLLDRIGNALERLEKTHMKILETLSKQEPSGVEKFFSYGTAIAAILGIIVVVDIVLKWTGVVK